MFRRNVVLLVSMTVMIVPFVVTIIVSDHPMKTFVSCSPLLTATVVIVCCLWVTWADQRNLRSDSEAADGQLDRKIAVASSLAGQTIRHLENDNKQLRGEVEELRRMVYGELAIDRGLKQFLIDDAAVDHRDG